MLDRPSTALETGELIGIKNAVKLLRLRKAAGCLRSITSIYRYETTNS